MNIPRRFLVLLCSATLLCATPSLVLAQQDDAPPDVATTGVVEAEDAAPGAGEEREAALPGWLPWALVGAGAVGVALSAVYVFDLLLIVKPALDEARGYRVDPDIACPGPDPTQACFDEQLDQLELAAGVDMIAAAPLGVGGVVAIVTGLGLLLEGEE